PRVHPGRSRSERPAGFRFARAVLTEHSSTTRKDPMRLATLKFWERFLRLTSRQRTSPPSRRPRRRLELEMLEDRTVPVANATVLGTVFIDGNANGIRDALEQVLPGVPVDLSGTTDQGAPVNLTAPTDAKG